jgi:photosystem II stability/assembly factor-like uncharacterized protein
MFTSYTFYKKHSLILFVITSLFFLSIPQKSQSQTGWVSLYTDSLYDFSTCYFINSNTGFAGGSFGNLVKTTNGGLNWNKLTCPDTANIWGIKFMNANTGYMVGDYYSFMKTTNGGLTWSYTSFGDMAMSAICFTDSNTAYIAGYEGYLAKTTNAGTNWTMLNSQNLTYQYAISFPNSNTGYVSGKYNVIIKTTNAGANWFSVCDSILWSHYQTIFFTDVNTGYAAGALGMLIKTTNGGVNWVRQTIPSINWIECLYFVNTSTGYYVADYGNMAKTTNGGTNWYVINSGTIRDLYCIYFVDQNTGYAVGAGGRILKTTTGGEPLGLKRISSEIPANYRLQQNYPNPFNPSTKIQFSIPPSQLPLSKGGGFSRGLYVVMKIYDISGREVSTLVNETLSPGTYEVEWHSDGFSSGIYFYKLEAGDFSVTRKMVLVK